MSARLRDNPDELRALITATAEALRISPAFVEKDFWATEVLRIASRPRKVGQDGEASFVFKGGTSLSRVFGLVERFSEDVDVLAHFPASAGKGARHAVFKDLDAEICEHLGVHSTSSSSDKGVKRFTTYTYGSHFGDATLKQGVLLELGTRGGLDPASIHEFNSMIALHALEAFGDDATVWQEFEPFEVRVLAPERTLFEKLAAVHAAATAGDLGVLARMGRHFYDIHQLLSSSLVTASILDLGRAGVIDLVDDINAHSQAAHFPWSPRPEAGFADSSAFGAEGPIHDAIVASYSAALALVYGQRPSFADVIDVVSSNRDLL